MNVLLTRPSPHTTLIEAGLVAAVAACQNATDPSRKLDSQIAMAVLPALIELPVLDTGIWLQHDGTRVRALRYSEARSAASTLVPTGCWIDSDDLQIIVSGASGEWSGTHPHEAISLCIAALSARIAEVRDGCRIA